MKKLIGLALLLCTTMTVGLNAEKLDPQQCDRVCTEGRMNCYGKCEKDYPFGKDVKANQQCLYGINGCDDGSRFTKCLNNCAAGKDQPF